MAREFLPAAPGMAVSFSFMAYFLCIGQNTGALVMAVVLAFQVLMLVLTVWLNKRHRYDDGRTV